MRTFKKISALVVAMAMIMTCAFTTVGFAADFTDVTDTSAYSAAIIELADKGIINGYANADGTYSFKPEGEITRAEFAKIIAVAHAPKGFAFVTAASSFTDVAADHWAVPYIEYAVKSGIINGMGDGTFAPSAPVTYAQAVKMVMCALNYGAVITPAPAGTPWYQPYIEMAHMKNITHNAFGNPDSNAARGLVAQLTFNMTKATPLVQKGFDEGGNPIFIEDDDNSEEDEAVEGQLIAVYETAIGGVEANLSVDEIRVLQSNGDHVDFTVGKLSMEDMEELLGYNVVVTYTEDSSGEKEIETITKSRNNETYVISSEDISNVTEKTFEYYDDDAKDGFGKLKINGKMSILKNGGDIDMDNYVEELNIDNGEITFIDCDGNGSMDVAFINSYETYFVGYRRVEGDNIIVRDKFNTEKEIKLNKKNTDIEVKLYANGSDKPTDSKVDAVALNTVLSVATTEDDEITKVIISKKTASGSSAASKVKRVRETVVTFGENDVTKSNYYRDIEEDSTQSLELGDSCTAYLDFTGKLVAVNKEVADANYGYILGVGAKSSGMDEKNYFVRMYDSSNKLYKELPVADKAFKLNGESATGEDLEKAVDAAAEVLNNDKDSAKIVNASQATLVKYEIVNDALKSVYLVDEITDTEDEDYISNAIHPNYISGDKALYYKSSNKSFLLGGEKGERKFTISSKTKVIVVPNNRADEGYLLNQTSSYFNDGEDYVIDAFDAVGSGSANVVVVYGKSTTIKANAPTFIVENILPEEEGNKRYQRLFYRKLNSIGSTTLEMISAEKDTFDGIVPGDLIKVLVEDGEVTNVLRIFSVKDDALVTDSDEIAEHGGNANHSDIPGGVRYSKGGSLYYAFYGTVTDIPKDNEPKEYIEIAAEDSDEEPLRFTITDATPVVRYTGDDDEPFDYDCTLEDVQDIDSDADDASKVFVAHAGNNLVMAIIIYK